MQTSQNDERRTTTGGIREFGTIQRGEAYGPRRREGGRETERPADNGEEVAKRRKLMKGSAQESAGHDKQSS